jgi:hypothetical protein
MSVTSDPCNLEHSDEKRLCSPCESSRRPSSCGTGSDEPSSTSVCTIGPWVEQALTASASAAASAVRIWHLVSLRVVNRQCSERNAKQSRSTASDVYSHPSSGFPVASTPQSAVALRSRYASFEVGSSRSSHSASMAVLRYTWRSSGGTSAVTRPHRCTN